MKNRPSGNPSARHGGIQPHEVRGEKLDEVLRMLKKLPISEVSRRAGISKATISKIAKRNGVVTVAGKPGPKRGRRGRPALVPVVAVVQVGANYRAQAAHQRWGSALGSRWS